MSIDYKAFYKQKLEALEAENKRLKEILKDAYRSLCGGDENDTASMLTDALEEFGYEFDDSGALVEDGDDD